MFEFLGLNTAGHEVATMKAKKEVAHALLGALGFDVDTSQECGNGDEWVFSDQELSIAEEALFLARNAPDQEDIYTASLVFLATLRQELRNGGESISSIIIF